MRKEKVATPTSRTRQVYRSLRGTPCRISEHLAKLFCQFIGAVGVTTKRLTKMVQNQTLHYFDCISIHV